MPQVLRPESIGAVTRLSNTQLSVGASNIIIGGQQYNTSAITITTSASGLNGIDTGSIASNQFYYVFLVKSGSSVGGVISLSSAPTGFSSYRLVGQCTTQSASTNLEAANSSVADNAPVGQIMSAMLTESQFRAIHGAGWILADGRSTGVSTSKYGTLTGNTSVPDLRGMVLRGKNNGRSDGNQNPGTTGSNGELNLGSYQDDEYESHSHGISVAGFSADYAGNHIQRITGNAIFGTVSTGGAGGLETRMRNITVNHFIKIN